jgi:hypothetical protein
MGGGAKGAAAPGDKILGAEIFFFLMYILVFRKNYYFIIEKY